jgi:hypothetical protein
MKVTADHHSIAEDAFKEGKNTPQVQKILHGKGLTDSQANSCCRTARKHLGLYKSKKQEDADNAKRSKKDANKQASKKTEVAQDG